MVVSETSNGLRLRALTEGMRSNMKIRRDMDRWRRVTIAIYAVPAFKDLCKRVLQRAQEKNANTRPPESSFHCGLVILRDDDDPAPLGVLLPGGFNRRERNTERIHMKFSIGSMSHDLLERIR